MRPLAVSLSIACLLAASGCHRKGEAAGAAASATPGTDAERKVLVGGVVCPLESVNGNSIRQSRTLRAGTRATLVGWRRVADAMQSGSGDMHVVFRSIAPDGSHDLSWSAVRVARPELATEGPHTAGYAGSGVLPVYPGKYKVLLHVDAGRALRECDTGEILDLQN